MTEMKLFNRWSTEGIEVQDPGLKKYISLKPVMLPKSSGRYRQQFHKSKKNIVERLVNKMMVPGHKGKKHVLSSGRCGGKTNINYKIVEKTFENIEKLTKKNPIGVFVKAIENAALREEITSYQLGGMMVRKAVITSPQRRIDLALSSIAQASYKKSFGKKENMVDTLTNEIIGALNNDGSKSEAIKERERVEREAEGAR
jgi:small subunit ribosomal protein S7